jgi:ATP-dependent DNA helicase RecQ
MAETTGNSSLRRAEEILRRYWGFAAFRPAQEGVVSAIMDGHDVLAILPTGGGKSICYQVPAMAYEGLTIVVSPLIALMQDQVEALSRRGIRATYLNSTLSTREIEQRLIDAEFGRYRLIYLAPERLTTDLFRERAKRLKVGLLAIDEAHCVSEWGRHFRPSYLAIAAARAELGNPPMIAVTATATPDVRGDIVEKLGLRSPRVFVQGFDRPNLVWSIFREVNKREKIKDVLAGVPGSGIVYAATRRAVEQWAAWLGSEGVSAMAYHGGMPAEKRAAAQEAWLNGACRVVVATNAFGMGIDKPDVRFVIHVQVPASLEAYYQEAGRGGRDGRRAYAVLLFDPEDDQVHERLIADGHPDAKSIRKVYDALCSLNQVAIGAQAEEALTLDAGRVSEVADVSIGCVRASVDTLVRQDVLVQLDGRGDRLRIRFEHAADMLMRYARSVSQAPLRAFVETLLRTVPGDAYGEWWEMDFILLERACRRKRGDVVRSLEYLAERRLLAFQVVDRDTRLVMNHPRTAKLPVDDLAIRRARRRSERQLQDMLRFARSVGCRRRFLLNYFGEKAPDRCGRCDVCLGRHEPVVLTPDDEPVLRNILAEVERGGDAVRINGERKLPPYRVESLIDWLVQEDYVRYRGSFGSQLDITPKGAAYIEQWRPREG